MFINIISGIITSIISSIIIILSQFIYNYQKRKHYEKYNYYEFEIFNIDECAPPEYKRESLNSGNSKVKIVLPFNIKRIQVFINDKIVYYDTNIVENSPIYICCDCDMTLSDDNNIAFTINCVTSMFENREYEFKKIYTDIGRFIGYALILKNQYFTIR